MKKIIRLTESDLRRLVNRVISEAEKFSNQEKIDAILDKISSDGYESLTNYEKKLLDNPDLEDLSDDEEIDPYHTPLRAHEREQNKGISDFFAELSKDRQEVSEEVKELVFEKMNKIYNGLRKIKLQNLKGLMYLTYEDSILFVDKNDKIIMEYEKMNPYGVLNNRLIFHSDLWKSIEKEFKLTWKGVQIILREWAENNLNLKKADEVGVGNLSALRLGPNFSKKDMRGRDDM